MHYLFVLTTLIIINLPANALAAQKLKISYLNHPSVTSHALPLIREVYKDAGIEADFFALPGNRLLQQIDTQTSDGDVILAQEIFEHSESVIKVGPPLTSIEFVLLCKTDVPCDMSVLTNPKTVLLSTDQSMRVIKAKYPQTKDTEFYNLNYLGKLPSLVLHGHFDYAIYIMSTQWPVPDEVNKLARIHLFKSEAYHVLHKKHADVAAKIAEILRQKLSADVK